MNAHAPYVVLRLREADGKFVGYDPHHEAESDSPQDIVNDAIHLSRINPGVIFGVFARTLKGSLLCADWYRNGAPI